GVFHEIRIGKVAGDQPIAELFLLDTTHIAKSPVNENHRHKRNPVTNGGGEFVAGVKKSTVPIDRQHRYIRSGMLDAESSRIAPSKVVLIARRQKSARLVDRKGKACGESDLRNLVDVDAILWEFCTDYLKKSELRRELGESFSQFHLPPQHLVST